MDVPWSLEELQALDTGHPVAVRHWLRKTIDVVLRCTAAEGGLLRYTFEPDRETWEAFRADRSAGRSIRDLTRLIDGMVDLEILTHDRGLATSCSLGEGDPAPGRLYLEWGSQDVTAHRIREQLGDVRAILVRLLEERQVYEHTLHDGLTGLYSSKSFRAVGEALLDELRSSGSDASYVMFNVDHIKAVNDRFGHAFGDRVLVNVARWIRSSMGPGQIAGRTMGNEFSVLLSGASMVPAAHWAERLRRGIGSSPLEHEGQLVPCRVSAGVVSATAIGSHVLLDLLRISNEMLQIAKNTGRDRVVAATPENRALFDEKGHTFGPYF